MSLNTKCPQCGIASREDALEKAIKTLSDNGVPFPHKFEMTSGVLWISDKPPASREVGEIPQWEKDQKLFARQEIQEALECTFRVDFKYGENRKCAKLLAGRALVSLESHWPAAPPAEQEG